MDLRQRAAQLKTDIPAVCLAFRHKGRHWEPNFWQALFLFTLFLPLT